MKIPGGFWIAIAALLWSTDALFRSPVVNLAPAESIVLFEHALGFLIISGWAFLKKKSQRIESPLKLRDWLSALMIGAGGSAIATLLFTASFRYISPSVSILLQKTQPLFVLVLARVFLGERPAPRFFGWAVIALAATVTLSVPDFHDSLVSLRNFDQIRGQVYALTAAALWALATVSGRRLSVKFSELKVLRLRYSFGLLALIALVAIENLRGNHSFFEILNYAAGSTDFRRSILYMALVPGLLALLFYYRGLERTPAIVATIIELIFPVGAVLLNWWGLGAALSTTQIAAGTILVIAVTRISLLQITRSHQREEARVESESGQDHRRV